MTADLPEPGPIVFGPPDDSRKWVNPANTIALWLHDGTCPAGTWLPSGRRLATELGVSPSTANRAMLQLQKAGLITLVNNRLGFYAGTGPPPRELRRLVFPRQPYKWRKYR